MSFGPLLSRRAQTIGAAAEVERMRDAQQRRMAALAAQAMGQFGDAARYGIDAFGDYKKRQERQEREAAALEARNKREDRHRHEDQQQRINEIDFRRRIRHDEMRLGKQSRDEERERQNAEHDAKLKLDTQIGDTSDRIHMANMMSPEHARGVLEQESTRIASQSGQDRQVIRRRLLDGMQARQAEMNRLASQEEAAELAADREAEDRELKIQKETAGIRKTETEADLKQAELDDLPRQRKLEDLEAKRRAAEARRRAARDSKEAARWDFEMQKLGLEMENLKRQRHELVHGRRPTAKEAASIDAPREVIRKVDDAVRELDQKGFNTGWLSSNANDLAQVFGVDDPEFSAWKGKVADVFAGYIHSKSGAAASDKERAFLARVIPNAEDDEDTFRAKANSLKAYMQGSVDDGLRALRNAGVDVSGMYSGSSLADKVMVRHNGKLLRIPRSRLQEALQDGAVQVGQ